MASFSAVERQLLAPDVLSSRSDDPAELVIGSHFRQ
jgi:hypothetical protein